MTAEIDPTAFWSVIATTAPVLGLALVLEARWLVAHGDSAGFPRQYIRLSSASTGLALVGLGASEISALLSLIPIGGDPLFSRWTAAYALALAVLVVMVAPGLALVRFGFAGELARLRTTRYRVRLWWLFRHVRRLRKRAAADLDRLLAYQLTIHSAAESPEGQERAEDVYLKSEALVWQALAALDAIDKARPRFRRDIDEVQEYLAEAYRTAGLRDSRALAELARLDD